MECGVEEWMSGWRGMDGFGWWDAKAAWKNARLAGC